jgi:SanA protein
MPHRRTLLRLALGGAAALVLVVAGTNAIILLGGGSRSTDDPRDAPHAQAALVLGAGLNPDGSPSQMLLDRLTAAAALYRDGKVGKVLASGDHGRVGYDEVNAMRRTLIRLGVPERDVFTDHAGFATLDSVVRARKVFNVHSAVIVTQGFHLPRALWLARRAGLEAHGLAADGHYGRRGRMAAWREVVARTKAVEDAVLRAKPKYLGPRIDIAGDGRASLG